MSQFYLLIREKEADFNLLSENFLSYGISTDEYISSFTKIVRDISFKCFGKKVKVPPNIKFTRSKKSEWFNDEYKEAKKIFFIAKKRYLKNKTVDNKVLFLESRSFYSKVKRKAKFNFYNNEKAKLYNLSKSNPRKFWSHVNKYRCKKVNMHDKISMNELIEHFSTTAKSIDINDSTESVPVSRETLLFIDQLDRSFTDDEVRKTILALKKKKKTPDLENIVADFFIDASTFITPHLTLLFNRIFEAGVYPESWSKGAIIPIYKKGDPSSPSNYRGITIVNTLSKIFSLLLRNRLNNWVENEACLNDVQFGFRDGRSTADAIFNLHSLIQKVLHKKHKLWCVFIDFERAFDTVSRNALWYKLFECGISCKIITMIKSMYQNVKSCVKFGNTMELSDFFHVTVGLKQGEPLSPLLFILFINDIVHVIDNENLDENDLSFLSIYLLLFADDIVLFTTNPATLQAQINNLCRYSNEWGLKINISKTKFCVFRSVNEPIYAGITINGETIEQVDNFIYLGVNFHYNGKMNSAVTTLHDQALKAYYNLLTLFDKINLDIKCKLSLFDSMIVPIILYGSEVWGIYNFKAVEKLHLRFCR